MVSAAAVRRSILIGGGMPLAQRNWWWQRWRGQRNSLMSHTCFKRFSAKNVHVCYKDMHIQELSGLKFAKN